MPRLILVLAAAFGAVPLSVGCSSKSRLQNNLGSGGSAGSGSAGDGGSDANGGSGGDASGGEGGGAGGDGPGSCDETASPSDAECLLTEDYGVFVAPTGNDTAEGSRAAPLRTIGKAQELASGGGKQRIYVCHGTYAEPVTISSATSEASLYGGFDCESWAHDGVKSVVAPIAGSALRIDGASRRVELHDLEFAGPDAEDPGASSVAAFVNASLEVAFDRVQLTAGKGANAVLPDAPPTNHLAPNLLDQQLAGFTMAKLCECPVFGSSTGGRGGNAGAQLGSGKGGADPVASVDPLYASADGSGGVAGACTSGKAGARGTWGLGGLASISFGSISTEGWQASRGGNGEAGRPGQGGGGGGYEDTENGGGGGCGSCGGNGGLGGGSGGSSIGLAVANTPVILTATVVVTSSAGHGATGGDGEDARVGGKGGSPTPGSTNVCKGGPGGPGAPGSGGAGGNGGVSVGIVYAESPPPTIDGMAQTDAATLPGFTLGQPGSGGNGGSGGTIINSNGVPSNFGKAGEVGLNGVRSAVLGL